VDPTALAFANGHQTRLLQCEYYEVSSTRTLPETHFRGRFPGHIEPRRLPGRPHPKHPHLSVVHVVKERDAREKNIWGVEKRDYTADWVPVNSPFVLLPRGVRCA